MGPSPRALAAIQAAYLVSSGVWPILHRRSFERVTGRKQDFWLVRTVGGLAAASGASLDQFLKVLSTVPDAEPFVPPDEATFNAIIDGI